MILGAAALCAASSHAQAQQPRIAIAAATSSTCNPTDVQTKLTGTGRFAAVDLINVRTSTPSLSDLLQYDAVVTWSNLSYQSGLASGNVFADYIDQGGAVVVAMFANGANFPNYYLSGRWITGGYEVIQSQGGYLLTAAQLGTLLQPSHPVLAGVVSLEATGGFRPITATLVQGEVIALWNDGKILAAVGEMPGRVDLGFFPPSDACQASFWNSGGDGTTLLANALEYVVDRVHVGARFCHPALLNSSGMPTLMDAYMGPTGLHLDARQGPPGEFGYFLIAPGFNDPGVIVGQGEFCLAASGTQGFVRYNVVGTPWNSLGAFDGDGQLQNLVGTAATGRGFDVPSQIPVLNTTIQSGQTWNFQLWHREPGGTTNFSNGLSVTF